MRLTKPERFLLYLPMGIVLTLFVLAPAVVGLGETFTTYGPVQPAPRLVGLQNFQQLFADRTFQAAVRNVAVFTGIAVPLELALGFGIAYALREPFRGRSLVRLLLLVPWLVSPVASGVMWHFLLDSETGMLNFAARSLGLAAQPSPLSQHELALLSVILVEVWRVAPLVAFLLLPGVITIPAQRWEDATLDGLSWPGTVRHVVLPSIRPLAAAVTILLIGGALATFDGLLTMTGGGPGTETMTPALYSYDKAFSFGDWPHGAAAAWVIGAALLGVGFVYLRLASRSEA